MPRARTSPLRRRQGGSQAGRATGGRRGEERSAFKSGKLQSEIASITPEQARLLEALTQAASRSAGALRAAVDLFVERRLFTADELRARVNRKS